jgi:PiT family inorganic phosphate transporter
VLGGLFAALASQGLVAIFSGRGFLESPIAGVGFPAAVALGALGWILFASKTGLPVSTTHAIAGALAGAGIVAQGAGSLHWGVLGQRVALPLALSPLLSVALLYAVYPLLRRAVSKVETYCFCLERYSVVVEGSALAMSPAAPWAVVSRQQECAVSPTVSARLSIVDGLHWLSSALTSFARGLNDAPKIVALGVVAAAVFDLRGLPLYVAVAAGMGAGSLVGGFRVTETLARRVTPMSPTEGFAANAVTTVLVGLACLVSLPVSTTHVSSGAIIGIGLHRGVETVRWTTVRAMLLAWLVTLPAAALIAAGAGLLLR